MTACTCYYTSDDGQLVTYQEIRQIVPVHSIHKKLQEVGLEAAVD